MQIATGTVVDGNIVLDGVSLPDGTAVTILASDSQSLIHLPPALEAELQSALDEADLDGGISGEALLESLRKFG